MESMKAAVLTAFGDAEKFEIQTVSIPTMKAHQVLVRVCATSINPVDYQTRRGDYKELVRLPAIIGVDVSGTIEAIGEAVTEFKVGDDVYYSPQIFGDFVTELGADRAIDYKNEDYVEVIRQQTNGLGVDLVLDTIGKETIQRSLEIIRPFGRLTSIVDIATPQSLLEAWGKNLTIHFVFSPQYRGFGNSSQPSSGYDYDTFAADLNALMTKLDLHNTVLIGFSMGTGEVTRYLGKYGSERVQKAVLMAPVPPFLLKTDDNPEGVDRSVFDGIMKAIVEDRPAYFSEFFKAFFNVDVLLGKRISNEAIQASWNVAVGASAKGTLDCVPSWLTDFRDDLPRIDVPTLIVHGDADRILPLESTAARLPKLIKNSQLVVIPGGPHAINWTHADRVNPVLLDFLQQE